MSRRIPPLQACLPRPAKEPPAGPDWIHEIKHDGFRILARREAERVRLFTRHGTDFTARFPKIEAAVASLPVRSCVVDGKAIVVDERGLSVFDILRYRLRDHDDEIEGAQQSEVRPDAVQKRPLSHSASLEPGKLI